MYVTDPVDAAGVEERIRALGDPAAAVVLLDRHRRDADAFAERLGVPVHETPFDGIADAPFAFPPIMRGRFWREVALWWAERRVLVAADALGTIPGYFALGGERLGVHPFLRAFPPRRPLADLEPEHVLVGHGDGVHGADAAVALQDALRGARRRIPRFGAEAVRTAARRVRR